MSSVTAEQINAAMDRMQSKGGVAHYIGPIEQDAFLAILQQTGATSFEKLPEGHRCPAVRQELHTTMLAGIALGCAIAEELAATRERGFLQVSDVAAADKAATDRMNALVGGDERPEPVTILPEQIASVFAGLDVEGQAVVRLATTYADEVVDILERLLGETSPANHDALRQFVAPMVLTALLAGLELERLRA